ncbi:hypothetical protein [Alicyclobacillus mengziensis]|uniref:Uncharacterized protein n=1 Tax=Alicyclobacillus mengziensis TaxID=2931921 RepID=A0A9X7Z9W3_9BACL|nr:hypothetical protein [Alicyclobacillus mengziensis]QSO50131.1 hypothetical protein JZ786_24505 [Alicyclobacillus mengziensis]
MNAQSLLDRFETTESQDYWGKQAYTLFRAVLDASPLQPQELSVSTLTGLLHDLRVEDIKATLGAVNDGTAWNVLATLKSILHEVAPST